MALTGFDPDLVNSAINSVKGAYDELMEALVNNIQNQFVMEMADKWACNDAQQFFNSAFKPAIDNLIKSSTNVFSSVIDSMNSAGQAWAMESDSSYTPVSFTANMQTIDVSAIKENIGGVRGIDLDLTPSVLSKLNEIESRAESALTNAQSAVSNCGFVGGNQASNLIDSLGVIKSKINTATGELITETKSSIDSTVQRYGNTEGKISQAFTASN